MRMLVLGAGLQGSACAYDLLQDNDVTEVRLADVHVGHLPEFLAPYSGPRLLPTPLDVRDHDAVLGAMRGSNAVMSAIPYYFNYDMARLAVEAGVPFIGMDAATLDEVFFGIGAMRIRAIFATPSAIATPITIPWWTRARWNFSMPTPKSSPSRVPSA